MKRKIYFTIAFLVFINSQAYSKENNKNEPSFYFSGFVPPKDRECIKSYKLEGPAFLNYDTCILEKINYFARNLNMSKNDLENIFNKLIEYEMDDFNITRKTVFGYDIITFESKVSRNIIRDGLYPSIGKATYILKNDKVIGYQILDLINISDYNNKSYTDSKISIIKKMELNNKLSTKDLKISFYSKEKEDFLETYCILDLLNMPFPNSKSWFYLDSFYPKKLKKEMKLLLSDSFRSTFGIITFNDIEKDDDKNEEKD